MDINKHMATVSSMAGQAYNRTPANVTFDELVQAGRIGVYRAISKGRLENNYIAQCVRNSMLDAMRESTDRHHKHPDMEFERHTCYEGTVSFPIDGNSFLLHAINQLDIERKVVLDKVYWEGSSIQQVASDAGVSHYKIKRLHNSAINMVRGFMKVNGLEPLQER